jgi:hypothetical protein
MDQVSNRVAFATRFSYHPFSFCFFFYYIICGSLAGIRTSVDYPIVVWLACAYHNNFQRKWSGPVFHQLTVTKAGPFAALWPLCSWSIKRPSCHRNDFRSFKMKGQPTQTNKSFTTSSSGCFGSDLKLRSLLTPDESRLGPWLLQRRKELVV